MQTAQNNTIPLSVFIIALNEENNLERCLASLPSGCEIILVDSGSHDRTTEIAAKYGAKIYQEPFTDYASQKNLALSYTSREWVLSLDADESLTPELSAALARDIRAGKLQSDTIYCMHRILVFMNKVMHFGRTVDYPARLFRRGRANFNGKVHETLMGNGSPMKYQRYPGGKMLHYSYRDLAAYFAKFNHYTTLVAQQHFERGEHRVGKLALCLRPGVNFLYRYIFRLGFLDGYPGFLWALLGSFYSFVKYAKLREMIDTRSSRKSE